MIEHRDRSAQGQGAVIAAAIVAFLGLGLPEGGLGVVFPAIRETFDLPLSGVGLLLVPITAGYIVESLLNARATRRLGVPRMLLLAASASAGGALLYVVGPVVPVLVVGSFFLGLSAGAVDVGLNAYASTHLEHRVLAFMHAGFGVGATLAPLAITTLLAVGGSWRLAYAGIVVLQVGLGITWFRTRRSFRTLAPAQVAEPHVARVPGPGDELVVSFEGDLGELGVGEVGRGSTAHPDGAAATDHGDPPRTAVARLNVASFFLYTGTEASVGALVATLLHARGMEEATAGLLAAVYWGALAGGRILVGALGPRLSPHRALRAAMAGALAGLLLLWFGGAVGAAAGLVLVGFSLAPVFPSLVGLTPERVGVTRTTVALGRQLAAAAVGVAAVPFVIGIVADHAGVPAIAPCLFLTGLAFVSVQAVTARLARAGHPRPAAP